MSESPELDDRIVAQWLTVPEGPPHHVWDSALAGALDEIGAPDRAAGEDAVVARDEHGADDAPTEVDVLDDVHTDSDVQDDGATSPEAEHDGDGGSGGAADPDGDALPAWDALAPPHPADDLVGLAPDGPATAELAPGEDAGDDGTG